MCLLADVFVTELTETQFLSAPEGICQSNVEIFWAEDEALGKIDNLRHYCVLLLVEIVAEVRSLISFFAVCKAAILTLSSNKIYNF